MPYLAAARRITQSTDNSHFFQQIEAALLPSAIPYAPEGTDSKAVVHAIRQVPRG